MAPKKKIISGGYSGIPTTSKKEPKPSSGITLSSLGLTKEELAALLKPIPLLDPKDFINTNTGGNVQSSTSNTEDLTKAQLIKDARDAAAAQAEKERQGTSAYSLLLSEFNKYGLGALVTPLQNLIKQGLSKEEFSLALQNTDAYQKRFKANTDRIAKGLSALSPAEYIGLEDQYQSIMRNYGLPASYYTKGDMGIQEGFNKLIANDVSAIELEDRVMTAQSRVINAPPQVKEALQRFYPDINNSDILAYTLDPEKGLQDIKRKVTAAEIGGAAIGAGLETDVARAEELAKFGVTAAKAREGYAAATPIIQRGGQLAGFYGEEPYTQTTVEEELFNLPGSVGATQKRKKLTALEEAQFSGRAGMTGGALSRDRAGAY
jgi:hypothetical protein